MAALDTGSPRWRAAAVMLRGADAEGHSALPALSALAASSLDPVVASWVLMRCGYPGRCAASDAQRWIDLEPDNLAAWLSIVELQPERKAEILQHAPAKRRFDLHHHELLEAVLQAMPTDLLPYVQNQVWVYVLGVEAAIGVFGPQTLTAHCRPAPAPGSQRQQDCAAIAKVLLGGSDHIIGRGVGVRLAELSGTPQRQVDVWKAETNAWLSAVTLVMNEQQPLSCAAVTRTRAWLEVRSRLGELAALKALHTEAVAASAPPR